MAKLLTTSVPSMPAATDLGRRTTRIGIVTLLIGLSGFMAWAAVAPLDEGVPTDGQVTIDTKRKSVQHLSGGIVAALMVREGQTVSEGQTLIQLEQQVVKAEFETVRQRYLSQRAVHARLLAEQAGSDRIDFHPDLKAAATDPQIGAQMANQDMLFRSRRAALAAELQALDESITGQRALQQSLQNMVSSRRAQLESLQDEHRNTKDLVRDGYAPRNKQLEMERQMAEVQTSLSDILGNLQRVPSTIAELQQKRLARQLEHRKEIETHLTDISQAVQAESERFNAASSSLERIDIRSPASGQVVGLAVHTVGGVVGPGQKLMDIIPQGEPLLLETRVLPHLIDKVQTGLKTDVRFSTFSHAPQLVIDGEVVSISGDLLTDDKTGMGYYLARVQITPEGMTTLGQRRMQPGMPAQVIIKTGERSVITYLLSPLLRRVAASMTEE